MPQYQGVWSLQSAAQLQSTQRWVTDPLFDYNTLLLQADSDVTATQNNTFLDSSSNSFVITRNGNTTQGSFTPFSSQPGAWSNYFGSSTSNLKFASNAVFAVGTGNFTVECFATFDAWASTNQRLFVQGSSGTDNLTIQRDSGANNLLINIQGAQPISYAWFPVPGRWYHIALVRSGTGTGQLVLYIDGVSVATGTSSASIAQNQVLIGGIDWASGYNHQGNISNLRYTVGAALYTANFTPPVTPLTTTSQGATASQVEILTCQDNRFIDNSSNSFSITVNGTTSVQPFSPFAPQYQWTPSVIGGSGYFDGTGDYLTAAGNAAFAFGTGDFTVAAWIYPTVATTFTVLSSNYTYATAAGNWSLYFGVGSAQTLYFNSNAVNKQSSVTTTIPLNAWTHVAYSRVGTTARFFVNGVQLGADISDSVNYGGSSGNLFVGQQSDGNGIAYGYMTSIQVLKGTGYSSLPLPTAPATNIANTSLLLNFTNAGIYDGTMKNNLETTGNVSVNTNVVKYGSGSIFFDGSGDYITMPNVQQIIGTMNTTTTLTIECWVYQTARPTFNESGLIGDMSPTAGTNYWSFGPNSNGYLFWYAYQSAQQTATSTFIPLNTWTHIAVSIQTGRIRLFVNGILQAFTGDAALTITSGSVGYLTMGQWNSSTNYAYTGYVDDLRITRGVARYITSFTPPTVALPRQ